MNRENFYNENANKMLFPFENEFGIPLIEPTQITCDDFIGFKERKKQKTDCGVHFFHYDFQLQCLWNTPDRYIEMLKKYKCVLSPDFSLYIDFPKALQIYNHYRKHWLAAYWQMHGIEVIPTIRWGEEDTYDWCFSGEPIGGTVAVSSVGTQKQKDLKEMFVKGYKEMLNHLQPKTIIFYGNVPEECEGNIIKIESDQSKFRRKAYLEEKK